MNLINETSRRSKKSALAVLVTNNSLKTSQSIKISKKFDEYNTVFDMMLDCVAKYNLPYAKLPDEYKNDTKFLVRCVVLKPAMINDIQKENKTQYGLLINALGLKGVNELKRRAKEEATVLSASKDGVVNICMTK